MQSKRVPPGHGASYRARLPAAAPHRRDGLGLGGVLIKVSVHCRAELLLSPLPPTVSSALEADPIPARVFQVELVLEVAGPGRLNGSRV